MKNVAERLNREVRRRAELRPNDGEESLWPRERVLSQHLPDPGEGVRASLDLRERQQRD